MDVRRMYDRCIRGMPYSEYVSEASASDTLTLIEEYFLYKRERMKQLVPFYDEQCKKSMNPESGIFELQLGRGPPTDPQRTGNFYLSSVHHLEHHADQLEYLVNIGELPPPFLDITFSIRWKIIPEIVKVVGGGDCIYDVDTRSHSIPECHPDFRRSTYLLSPWMTDLMQGTFNTLIHMPTPLPLPSTNPFCLNPNLNFEEIQNAYLAGKVLVIDSLLTPHCLSELRRLALEGTIFYDAKKSYMGAYVDQGMGESPWLLRLSEDWKARFPKILNLPLSTSWFYKYDSASSEAGGIGIHADQAIVNINIWVTPDDANLDPTTGGLIVYDTAPPAEDVFGSDFDKWNNEVYEKDRMEWLNVNGAKHLKIPHRSNRAVVFDSRRLHATDEFHFRPEYENKRINLTLLFGIVDDVGEEVGSNRENNGKFPNELSFHT